MTKTARGFIIASFVGIALAVSGQEAGSSSQLDEFINLQSDCPTGCPVNAEVCCYKAPPIVVEV